MFNKENKVDYWRNLRDKAENLASNLLMGFSTLSILVLLYDVGFNHNEKINSLIPGIYTALAIVLFTLLVLRSLIRFSFKWKQIRSRIPVYILQFILGLSIFYRLFPTGPEETVSAWMEIFSSEAMIYLLFFIIFFIEISKRSFSFMDISVSPALIFVLSFMVLILIGTGLLLLPKATPEGISFIDAFFTATSAVCVTGLIVLDTSADFTFLGQFFILLLIQAGGLGIMTFTSFFGFFFKGNTSYQNQLFFKDLINEENLGEIFRTLIKIVIFTFLIEAVGAFFIYHLTSDNSFTESGGRLWFAVFHSISAYCNAGFSTLSNGLYESGFSTNYNFHLIIIFLIVIGGIGFPIIFNFWHYIKSLILRQSRKVIRGIPFVHIPRILNINTKIVVITTLAFLAFGFISYAVLESANTLEGKSVYGKIVTALFGAVTPRTAGFNTVDMSALAVPTVLIYLFLMWVGASPGSTGGGIKTSTFTLALLNIISIAKGKNRVEIFKREIHNESIRRALAIILLSFLVIGTAIFFLSIFEQSLNLLEIIFESFSAFSTVGLTLGITPLLGTPSKIVIILTMFIGRVGTLTILVGIIRKVRSLNYRYPGESIFIN